MKSTLHHEIRLDTKVPGLSYCPEGGRNIDMAPKIVSPFDPAARNRLRRMGLLSNEDQINTHIVEAISVVQAGLLFSQIYDSCGDWDGTIRVCQRIVAQAARVSCRQVLLLISIQYDAIAKPLPELIWWISGSDALLTPFVHGFVRHLDELCVKESCSGGDGM